MEMGTHDTRGPIDKAAITSKRIDSLFDSVQVNPTLAATYQRRCVEGHDLCWMHPAEPGREGIVAGPAVRFGDDADRDSTKAARLAELVKRMDRLVSEWQVRSDIDPCYWADTVALTWKEIRTLTQEGAAS